MRSNPGCRSIGLVVGVAAAAVLAGCGGRTEPAPPDVPDLAADPDVGSSPDAGPGADVDRPDVEGGADDGAGPDARRSPFTSGVCIEGWCWEQPVPFGTTLVSRLDFWAASPDEAWVDLHGHLARWHEGRWTATDAGVGAPLAGSGPGNVVGATKDGAARFDGVAWTPMPPCPRPSTLWVAGPDDAWLASVEGKALGAYHATLYHWDGTRCTASATIESAEAALLAGSAPDDGWLAVTTRDAPPPSEVTGGAWHWDGKAWSKTALAAGSVWDLAAPGGDSAWLAATSLWRWSGGTWTDTDTGIGSVYQLSFAGPADGWASVGFGADADRTGRVLRWDGEAWTESYAESDYPLTLFAAGASDLLALLPGGRGARWDGLQWTPTTPSRSLPDLVDVAIGPSGEAWAVSGDGRLRRRPDGWQLADPEGGWAVWSGAPGEAWVAGLGGLRRWDGASHPVAYPGANAGSVVSIGGSSPDDVLVATPALVSRWQGTGWAWSRPAPAAIRDVKLVRGSGPDDLWILGSYGVARAVGDAWEVAELPPGCLNGSYDDLQLAGPGEAWVVGRGSYWDIDYEVSEVHVARRKDGGWTCSRIREPLASLEPIRLAACDGESWISTPSGLHRFEMPGSLQLVDVVAGFRALACRSGAGFWGVGVGGRIVHRAAPARNPD